MSAIRVCFTSYFAAVLKEYLETWKNFSVEAIALSMPIWRNISIY